jgi:hypothetical protein
LALYDREKLMDLFAHLRRQLDFIARSCESYDHGHSDEAIRIAQQVRVIVHQTSKSTSLLTQLGATHVRLLTTVTPVSSGTVFFDGMSFVTVTRNPDGDSSKVDAALTAGPFHKLFPVDDWWNQLLYVRNEVRITRRDLILTAANKDGGAHIDPKLTPAYEELTRGIWSVVTETATTTVPDSNFHFLRQVGYEIVHSPDLQTMAKTGKVPPFVQTPAADLQPEPVPPPKQIGAKELSISEAELAQFVAACRQVVTREHFQLLWNLYTSSPGAFTGAQGEFDKAVAAGYPGSLSDWLSPLLSMGLLEAQVHSLPRGGQQTMYSLPDKGRAFVTAVVRNGG